MKMPEFSIKFHTSRCLSPSLRDAKHPKGEGEPGHRANQREWKRFPSSRTRTRTFLTMPEFSIKKLTKPNLLRPWTLRVSGSFAAKQALGTSFLQAKAPAGGRTPTDGCAIEEKIQARCSGTTFLCSIQLLSSRRRPGSLRRIGIPLPTSHFALGTLIPAILETVVEVRELGKKYGNRWILRDLTFSLVAGDCLIVTGKNGAGKSTLLKVLSGLERPSAGTLTTDVTDYRTELSYCALEQATFANLTVIEHLKLAAKVRSIESDDARLILDCGLEEHKDVQSQYLSSGLRSRLKIALAIQTNPKILLWDEPGVALDGAGKALIARVIEQQKQRGLLVIATNDPEERRFGTHELEL